MKLTSQKYHWYFPRYSLSYHLSKRLISNYFVAANIVIYGKLAKVKNWGVDWAMDYGKKITKHLSVEFRGTFTFAHNNVLEYDEASDTRPAHC